MAYIEKEPIIEFITKGLNNLDKSEAYGYDAVEILTEIEYTPVADVVEVVRCKDCKYFSEIHHCGVLGFCEPNEYCSRGERMDESATDTNVGSRKERRMTNEEAIIDIRENIQPIIGGKSLDIAVSALEKQIPKKPIELFGTHAIYDYDGSYLDQVDITTFKCPICNDILAIGEISITDCNELYYCNNCGQKLSWESDTDEN